MAKKGCKICHSRTQELYPTGRCGSCAAVLRAKIRKISYGNLIALEAAERAEKAKAEIMGKHHMNFETQGRKFDEPKVSPVKDRAANVRICERCGAEYLTKANNAKHCPECRIKIQAELSNARKKMNRMHKHTGGNADGE